MQNHAKHLPRFLYRLSIAIAFGMVTLSPNRARAFSEKLNVYNEAPTVASSGSQDQVMVDVKLRYYPSGDMITNHYYLYDNTQLNLINGYLDHTTATYFLGNTLTHQDPVLINVIPPDQLPAYFYSEAQGQNGGDEEYATDNPVEISSFTCDAITVRVIGPRTQKRSGPFTFREATRQDWYTVRVGVATGNDPQKLLQLNYSGSAGVVPKPKQDTLSLTSNTSVSRSVLVTIDKEKHPLLFSVKAGSIAVDYPLGLNQVTKTVEQLTLSVGPMFSSTEWKVPIDRKVTLPASLAREKHSNMKVVFSAKGPRGDDLDCTPSGATNLTYTPDAKGAAGTWDGPKSVSVDATGVHGPVTFSAILVFYDKGGKTPKGFNHSTINFGP